MVTKHTRAVLLGLLLVVPEAPAQGPPAKPPRADGHGDPLPRGALARLGTPRLFHPDALQFLFLPDGKALVAADSAGARLWEVGSGRERRRFEAPLRRPFPARAHALAVSPDGKFIAAAYSDNAVRVWDVDRGKEVCQLGRKSPAARLAFGPDGRLAAWGQPGPIEVWDVRVGKCLLRWGQLQAVDQLLYSPDGKDLVTVHREPPNWRARVFTRWDAATGRELARNTVAGESLFGARASPDGRLLAWPTDDGKVIRLLDPWTGKELGRTEGEASYPAFLAFSADGRLLTSSSRDGVARVWDTATGKRRYRVKVPGETRRVSLSPDGKVLAAQTGRGQEILLVDVASGELLHSFGGHRSGPLTVAFGPDGKTVATTSRDASHAQPVRDWSDWSLRRWDPETGEALGVTRADLGGEVHYTAFSRDGSRLATVTHDGTLRLWDVARGKESGRGKVPVRYSRIISGGKEVDRKPNPAVSEPAFSADGAVLLAAGAEDVHRWEVATAKELPAVPHGMKGASLRCQPAPDGRSVLVLGWTGSQTLMKLLDLGTGKTVREYPGGSNPLRLAAFSPDGRTLAFADRGAVRLLEVETGRERAHLTGGPGLIAVVHFSLDGRRLAAGGYGDTGIRLWHLPSGEPLGKLEGADARVDALAFSPDGRRLASGGSQNTALVWDVDRLAVPAKPAAAGRAPRDLERLWGELCGADAARAYRAIGALAEAGRPGALFLGERLTPPAADRKQVARLVADLDDERADVRQKAMAALGRLGRGAEAELREALAKHASPDVRLRAGVLLRRLENPGGDAAPPAEVVGLRAIEALEAAATPESRRVLEGVARGSQPRWAREARAALERLAARP